ncbi:inorganic polyphosphate kinase [Porphyromonas crevioricanis]|uniref:NAD kinase n=2 Tax=Porphyromonas crevioricanis TaxID=393921 RepID=A0A0A2FVE5_9PORP|nr:NAD kinase [Porphyromonas crevioricanis]KGN89960.1 inorganic polyphosphate kinase [Porphyromonas crevioricanis]KGN94142.1 inorganic polyphosphate kinase [Porphyromonas crevioricanis]SJZ67043.1 NAD+ kinase [Porphyromonas crevioricanis]SQH73954.1 Probable inorganic polyphosphate/ATP-NAD kinase [Porphyromonas crevioricanis]GAD04658.1 NAD kinase [Porphyromonas crevioricanis JCM 15906]
MEIAVFGSQHKVDQAENIVHFICQLSQIAKLSVERQFYGFIRRSLGLKIECNILDEETLPTANYVVSIGGDGTFLRAARYIGATEIPIWGINSGRLGFLTDADCSEAIGLIDKLVEGIFELESRSILQIEVGDHYIGHALNEAAIMKRETGSIITIDTYLGDDYLAAYDADGLIIATPTGSTAYSLSVNGPLIMPHSQDFVLSPIAPHTLNMRPLVVPDNTIISMTVSSRSDSFLLSLDGKASPFDCGEPIRIRKADYSIRLMKVANHSFADTLRKKLMWGAAVRS